MPETTIHMTCSRTHQVMELRVTKGGDVKAAIVGAQGAKAGAAASDEE
jgi:hypothetical protein